MKVLITGANSDISISIKDHLEKKQHSVFLTSRSEKAGDLVFDLAHPDQSGEALDQLLSQGLDALILNAASPTYRLATLDQIEWSDLDRFLKENIQGNIWLLQKILPVFKQQKFGRIIFVSSMSSQIPIKGYSVYAAAKSALETLMKYIAAECGEDNIVANVLRLGVIHTSRNDKFVRRSSIREKMISAISLKRIGKPEDLHAAVDALLDKNCFIQGSVIDVTGGLSNPL